MAKTHDVMEHPVHGDRLTFLVTSEDSKGESLKFHLRLDGAAKGPPEHRHPTQTETYHVLSGRVGMKCDNEEHVLTGGQSFVVPVDAPHRFWNAGDTPAELTIELRPALRTEFFFETMYALAQRGQVDKSGVPKNVLHFMTILDEFYGESILVGPPVFLQKLGAKVLGRLGRLLGYRGFVPYEYG